MLASRWRKPKKTSRGSDTLGGPGRLLIQVARVFSCSPESLHVIRFQSPVHPRSRPCPPRGAIHRKPFHRVRPGRSSVGPNSFAIAQPVSGAVVGAATWAGARTRVDPGTRADPTSQASACCHGPRSVFPGRCFPGRYPPQPLPNLPRGMAGGARLSSPGIGRESLPVPFFLAILTRDRIGLGFRPRHFGF